MLDAPYFVVPTNTYFNHTFWGAYKYQGEGYDTNGATQSSFIISRPGEARGCLINKKSLIN